MATKLTDDERKERNRIKCKAYYDANKEKVLARVKAYQQANKDKINERCRTRSRENYATDPDYKAKVIAAGKKYRNKHKTGYGRGRPQIGEDRPVSVLAERANRYRKDNEQWAEYNRRKQAEWIAANPERVKEIKKGSIARRKLRDQAQE